jgi:hypothetical protein
LKSRDRSSFNQVVVCEGQKIDIPNVPPTLDLAFQFKNATIQNKQTPGVLSIQLFDTNGGSGSLLFFDIASHNIQHSHTGGVTTSPQERLLPLYGSLFLLPRPRMRFAARASAHLISSDDPGLPQRPRMAGPATR